VIAAAIAFVASFCTLVIELVAGRIMAPYIGVSLYTWTSIIGVCLAGISVGNYVGGKLADRYASRAFLGGLLGASGLAAVAVLPLTQVVVDAELGRSLPVLARILAATGAIFFLPTFLLGTVSPVVVRLALADLRTSGSTVGRIYAVSTAGAIAGTFATGFWLIEALGTRQIVWGVGAVLVVLGTLVAAAWRRKGRAASAIVALLVVSLAGALAPAAPCLRESAYYCIAVHTERIDGREVKALGLDHLVHSYVDVDDPTYLAYGYVRVYQEITEFHLAGRERSRALFIGAGGYSFPRYLAATHAGARSDVLEIDPAVTVVAREELGLRDDPRIRTFDGDARLWFIENDPAGTYDLVYGDAFNDLSIPYHLTTVEFDRLIRRALAPDGIVMANVIDDQATGGFLPAMLATFREAFEHVYLFAPGPVWQGDGPATYVLVASPSPVDLEAFEAFAGAEKASAVMPPAQLLRYVRSREALLLTDDHAPVDNLVAPLFAGRGGGP
jgi:spermidine synthase